MKPEDQKIRVEAEISVHLRDNIRNYAQARKLSWEAAVEILLSEAVFMSSYKNGFSTELKKMPAADKAFYQPRKWPRKRV